MNRKLHRVLKELKHYVTEAPAVQPHLIQPIAASAKKDSLVMDFLKDRIIEADEDIIDLVVDKFCYEILFGI